MAVSFDGVTLPNPGLIDPHVVGSEVFEVTISGQSTDLATINALAAKAGRVDSTVLLSGLVKLGTTGTKGSLVIDADTYPLCVIDGGVDIREIGAPPTITYGYTVRFVRQTAPTS